MKNLIEEMMKNAAKENEMKFEGIQIILEKLEENYGIELDENAPVTWQLMKVITDEIQDWIKK